MLREVLPKSLRTFVSTPSPLVSQLAHPPSIAEPHRSREDHLGSAPQVVPGWKAISFVFGALGTSCLYDLACAMTVAAFLLFSTSKQILPSLSIFGWYIFVRNLILGGVMG